jgi:peptidoglycan/xylan/chitin deacetylase (PgdA/CDA1 family)
MSSQIDDLLTTGTHQRRHLQRRHLQRRHLQRRHLQRRHNRRLGRVASFPRAILAAFLIGVALQLSFAFSNAVRSASALEPIPDKLVVMTFDDSSSTHFDTVRPLLKEHGFNATFFITAGFEFATDKQNYLTWQQIAQLHREGFEIGNHTRDHRLPAAEIREQLEAINQKCREHDIPVPVTLAYPGNQYSVESLKLLRELGIQFARRGGTPEYPYDKGLGWAYEPGLDHPLLVPSAGDARPDWKLADLVRAAKQAKHGRIAVLQFHGVPDRPHPWVSTEVERFSEYLKYLKDNEYQVIALRDLAKYVDPDIVPNNPLEVIEDRTAQVAVGRVADNTRLPGTDKELLYWLLNMRRYHHYTWEECSAATGIDTAVLKAKADKLKLDEKSLAATPDRSLLVLPFPGGRHPRIGFRDGAMRPQRESKVSVFAPWDDTSYFVVDVPEAIWVQAGEQPRELLYLAHTHVPTMWSKQGVSLPPLEWDRLADGGYRIERELPNRVRFGAQVDVVPGAKLGLGRVEMRLWLHNGSDQLLSGLRVQNCVMLAGAKGFEQQLDTNKVYRAPFAAAHDSTKTKWVVTAWENCVRPWGNTFCPCLHSDPQFEDCPPGERRELRGIVTFYEGEAIEGFLDQLADEWK